MNLLDGEGEKNNRVTCHKAVGQGTWDKYRPVPVKIQVNVFMEKDQGKVSHWFNLEEGRFIQGLL